MISTQNQFTKSNDSSCSPPVPESVMTSTREEFTNIQLETIWGELPKDLQGHVFIAAPNGSVNSNLPYPNGDPIVNGDGTIYRLDFDRPGEVRLSSKLVKPPCYYADDATKPGTQYEKYQFSNHGMGRFSISLGLRNELNTAFLPMKFAPDESDRLLICWDGGRPYEVDPVSLEVATPMGSNQEWRPEAKTPFKFIFNPVMSSAHPYFDSRAKDEKGCDRPVVFTVNYGKSLATILKSIPCPFSFGKLPGPIDGIFGCFAEFLEADKILKGFWSGFFQWLWQLLICPIGWLMKIFAKMDDFVYLISWDGKGDLERWNIVRENGSPLKISQTMHQIGVTEKYVLLMDTAFQFGIGQVINNPLPKSPGLERFLRSLLTTPQLPDTVLYIISRADLKPDSHPAKRELPKVKARKVVIPREAIHFLEDYENPDDRIVIHIGHVCAWEGAEWVRNYDFFANTSEPIPDRVHGMISEEMDISYVGRYILDGETGEILKQDLIRDFTCTWGIAFYTYQPDPTTGMMPAKLDNIYWTSLGLWKETLTNFLFHLTEDYPYRTVSPSDMLLYGDEGVPPCLFRVSTGEAEIAICDRYQFPEGYMVNSIQFVPSKDSQESSTKGYIVCMVFLPANHEIWIFNAENLAKGPECKLNHSCLEFGFTTHATWLPKIANRTACYNVGVRHDYESLVKAKNNSQIEQMFEKEVYPHFS